MKIKEVCQKTGLTKKAIEYYQSKEIVTPHITQTGYREFSEEDVEKLKKVALLRKLELSIEQIRNVLDSENPKNVLASIKGEKQIDVEVKNKKLQLLDELIQGTDSQKIMDQLDSMEKHSTIREKLLQVFPGFYGRFISLHFGQFLNEPIKTNDQKKAYHTVIRFLDEVDTPSIPEDIQKEMEEAFEFWTDERVTEVIKAKEEAINDVDSFLQKNEGVLKEYSAFKLSEEYSSSLLGQLLNVYRSFGETSGYYDTFIPAMRRLSNSYEEYYQSLIKANERLIEKMPEVKQWNNQTENR